MSRLVLLISMLEQKPQLQSNADRRNHIFLSTSWNLLEYFLKDLQHLKSINVAKVK